MTFKRSLFALAAAAALAIIAWQWFGTGNGREEGRGDRGQQPVLVTLAKVEKRAFADVIEAVGSARANESVEITAKVSDTVSRLNFTDGQNVPAGFLVAEMSQKEQTADLVAAEANLREQEQSLSRAEKLRARGFVSNASLDALRAARDTAAARVAATRSRTSDRALRTPFAGRLGLRRVSVGALVRPGDVVTTLDDISRIKVDFPVAETRLSGISLGQTVRATAAAFPGEVFTGTVESIDTRIDTASRSVTVRAVFPNDKSRLRPGMLMTVGIETNPRTALAVAEQTLVPVETRQYVYLVSPDGKAERREVVIGARIPGHVEILSGVKEGDSLVLEGTLKMRPGATVKVADDTEKAPGSRKGGGERSP